MGEFTTHKYILKDRKPVICADLRVWASWFEEVGNRRVGNTEVGDLVVNTIFLGLDHSFGSGPPILWETMVFDGEWGNQERCAGSWEQAEEMHRRMVEKVKKQQGVQ